MFSSINSVCTIDSIRGNTLIVEVMPNNLNGGDLQFYLLNGPKPIKYVNFNEFNSLLQKSLDDDKTFYITFCGISNRDYRVPEYLYLAFNGHDVCYNSTDRRCKVFLEFTFKKSGPTLEKEIQNLFTDNVGVFIQSYL